MFFLFDHHKGVCLLSPGLLVPHTLVTFPRVFEKEYFVTGQQQ
ncbi:hypothetical protein T11_12863 [Trichinella zimbabwensis]|uniref:Uncharacterized protein n=1 Tax=Trichinella zimbabwensis TaxID=268475 RepID=A0A0V1GCX7_9BILA|nr:hypothetical protein T11_12863 [Trichinella zimbabwensis]